MNLTKKRLFASMSKFMSLEMTFCYEFLVAFITNKWSFSCMCPHVSFKVPGFSEFFQTFFKRTNQNFLFFFRTLNLFKLWNLIAFRMWRKGVIDILSFIVLLLIAIMTILLRILAQTIMMF